MKNTLKTLWLATLASFSISLACGSTFAQDKKADPASVSLFDGKSLQGWSGLTNWSVQDGAITGENKADAPIAQNTFLVYEKPVKDFELTLEFKIVGGNSGIQYRSKLFDKDKFVVGGYQADIDANKRYMGINYEERGRGIMAERGEIVAVDAQGKKSRVGSAGDADALLSQIKWEDWNRYKIVAKGHVLQHFINDQLMSEVQDSESAKSAAEGVLALQLHAGPPMKVQFKNIMLKSTNLFI
ncbi:MAG: DUF1080 domain-containing protein [Planctomycetaceae bacterium]|nr:DUF1080 domain-containing protein [Planctomycetaceae bacterium]